MIYRRKKWVLLVSVIVAGIVVNFFFETPNLRGGGASMMVGILFLTIVLKATIEFVLNAWDKQRNLKRNEENERIAGKPLRRGEPVKEVVSASGRCKVIILRDNDDIYRLEVHVLEYEDYTRSDHWQTYDVGSLSDSLERAETLALEEIRRISASEPT